MNRHSPVSRAALEHTHCANFAGVTISCADLLVQCPEGPFDLIVFSELDPVFRLDTWRRR
jgi:hypothetical protein